MMNMQARLAKIMAQKRGFTDAILTENKSIVEKINSTPIKSRTIAVIESHKKHADVFVPIIHYFLELGFTVNLFCLYEHDKDDSLCNVKFSAEHFHKFSFPIMPESEEFFELLTKYEYIFVDTIFTHDGYNFINALDKGFRQRYNKNNVYCIDHDFVSIQKGIQSIEQKMINEDKVFVLRDGIEMLGKKLPFVTPTWFGDYTIPAKPKKTHFICVGGGYQDNLRNFKLLFESIDSLIKSGITNFDITFVGTTEEMLSDLITAENKEYLYILGFTPYKDLYENMEKANFILFNIDDTCNEYEKYLNTGITGSYSLSLGFATPAIAYEPIIRAYQFEGKSISYGKNDLYSAMRTAIDMSGIEYQKMCQKLRDFNQELMSKSIENLRKVMPYDK